MKHLFLSIIATLGIVHAASIHIVAKENCPYYCSPYAVDKGFVVDIAAHVFKGFGYTIDYTTVATNEAAVKGLHDRDFDIFLSDEQHKETGLIFVKTPLAYRYNVILVPKLSKWRLKDPEGLNHIKIAVREEQSYSPLIQRHIDRYKDDQQKIVYSKGKYGLKDNLVKLQYNEVNAIIDNQHLMQYFYHEKRKLFPFKVANKLQAKEVYGIFSNKNYKATKHAKRFNRALKQLQGSSEMAQLLSHYGLIEKNIQKPRGLK